MLYKKHVNQRMKTRKMESYLKSHQSLFLLCVCCGLRSYVEGGLAELRISLRSADGNLHVSWRIGNNERLKKSEMLSLTQVPPTLVL